MRTPVLTTCIVTACAICSPLAAEAEWKTIQINAEPDFRIDIPAAVDGHDEVDPAKGIWMGFFAESSDSHLFCAVMSLAYPAPREEVIAAVNDGVCLGHGGETDEPGQPMTSNGLPAVRCVSSYSQSDEELPGKVRGSMTVAATNDLWAVSCTMSDQDQLKAEDAWFALWKEVVIRVQDSLQLPASRR